MRIEISFPVAAFAAILSSILVLAVFVVGVDADWQLRRESGLIEIGTAAAFLLGMGFALYGVAVTTGWLRVHFALWAVLCVVFFGEETSWLQHLLGYAPPETFVARNAQGEFNFHNLDFFQGGELLEDGEVSWGTFLKSQHLFRLGFGTYFALLPLALLMFGWMRDIAARFSVPVIGPNFMLATWVPIIASMALTLVSEGVIKHAVAETRELFMGLAIGGFVMLAAIQSRPRVLRYARPV